MGRNGSVECLRVLAMLEIVAFHAAPTQRLPLIGGLGLPVFLLLTGTFAVLGADRRGAASVVRAKVTHLGVGWLAWCGVYAAERALLLRQPFSASMLLYGPSIHLWFVPFSIIACATVATLHQSASRVPAYACAPALLAIAVVPIPEMPAIEPLTQWGFALPAIPLGMALGQVVLSKSRAALLAAVMVGLVLALHNPRYGFALAAVAAAFAFPTKSHRVIALVGPCMLGIYYVHAGIDRALRGRMDIAVHVAVVFGLSLAIALAARSTPAAALFSSERRVAS